MIAEHRRKRLDQPLKAIWAHFSNILIAKPVTELYDKTEHLLA